MKKLILVVCRGNIHRSVIAELCIRQNLRTLGLDGKFSVQSRGLQGSCQTVAPAHPNIRQFELEWGFTEPVLQELGIEIPEDRVWIPIDKAIVVESSLVLAMDTEVLRRDPVSLLKQFPEYSFKMKLYSEMASDGNLSDVLDCAGEKNAETYRQVISFIHETAEKGTRKMCQLAEILTDQTQPSTKGDRK